MDESANLNPMIEPPPLPPARSGMPPEANALLKTILNALLALGVIYIFIASVNMMGAGLKVIAKDEAGKEFLDWLFSLISDPISGLFIGLLITSLVQSSSFTTSMTIAFVAAGDLSLETAIPIIMGANIGTSVTNILVSLAHVRRRLEFRRSFGAAIVHDFFNVLSVLLFLPLEHAFGIFSRSTRFISDHLAGTKLFPEGATDHMSILKRLFGLVGNGAKWLVLDVMGFSDTVGGAIVAAVAIVLLFISLWLLVKLLRGLMQGHLSGVFDRTLFRNPATAFIVGILLTAAVQSSSVTTSLVVPLVATSILKIKQVYPYMLGANIGTTVTAMLAALGTGSAPAMACAFGHLLFNISGTVVFWPLKFIPISLAKGFAKIAAKRRYVAGLFVLGFFIVLPIAIILIKNLINGR